MTHEKLLKNYFERESTKGDLSAEQWETALLRVRRQKDRGWFGKVMAPFTVRQPALAVATSLVLAVMVGAISLWIIAPWEGHDPYGPPAIPGIAGDPNSPGIPGRPGSVGIPGNAGEPGIPAPTIFEPVWKTDKSLITPGESVMITLTIKNVSDATLVFREFPTTMTLTQKDRQFEESIPLEFGIGEGAPGSLAPGGELIVIATVTPDVSSRLQFGRYSLRISIEVQHSHDGTLDMHRGTWGMGSKMLFVVTPPEGALNRNVVVDQAVEGDHARITLESIRFTPEQTTIVAFAESMTQGTAESQPTVAGTPTPAATIQPGATPTPASAVAQSPWDGDITELTAFYRLDGGTWRVLRNYAYRETPDGVHHEWSFGPVSVNAKTLEIAILPGNQPGRDGTWSYPAGDTASSWEWSVSLQDIETR